MWLDRMFSGGFIQFSGFGVIVFDSDLFPHLGTTGGLKDFASDKDNVPFSSDLMREILFSKLPSS